MKSCDILTLHVAHLQPELNIVASFDRRGERIVTGSSKGKVRTNLEIKTP